MNGSTKSIILEITPEEAHNALVIIDLALKHKNGGVKIAKPSMELVDKIQRAVQEAQNENRPDVPPAPFAGE